MKKVLTCIFALFLSSCVGGTSPSSTFYQIKSLDNAEKISNKKVSVGIDRVQIPPYLDRPQIVTTKEETSELNVSEFNRWAEPLSASLPRIIANDISSYLPNSLIKVKSSFSEPFTYTLTVEINKFDGVIGKEIELDTWWTIYKDGKIVARQRSRYTDVIQNSYDDMIEKQGYLIGLLSKDIASKISKL